MRFSTLGFWQTIPLGPLIHRPLWPMNHGYDIDLYSLAREVSTSNSNSWHFRHTLYIRKLIHKIAMFI
jgi:hypothetical protein